MLCVVWLDFLIGLWLIVVSSSTGCSRTSSLAIQLPSLSCGPATLPTKINSSLSLGTHPSSSMELTPTVSIGIVADTPGNSFTLFRPLVKSSLPGTHPILSLIITGTKPSSTFRCFGWFNHHTVGAFRSFIQFIPTAVASSLLLFVLSLSTVSLPSRIFITLHNLLESYGLSCSSIVLTKQSSSNQVHFLLTPAVGRSWDLVFVIFRVGLFCIHSHQYSRSSTCCTCCTCLYGDLNGSCKNMIKMTQFVSCPECFGTR
jgi:hypothetical protein